MYEAETYVKLLMNGVTFLAKKIIFIEMCCLWKVLKKLLWLYICSAHNSTQLDSALELTSDVRDPFPSRAVNDAL